MAKLDATINELWPNKAKIILKERGISRRALKKEFHDVYFPWDVQYNNYKLFFKSQVQEFPLFIISATSTREIQKGLDLALNKTLSVRITSGRHSANVQNPDFYLDMSQFTKIKLYDNKLVVGGGLNQGSIYEYLGTHSRRDTSSGPSYHYVHGSRFCHTSHSISRCLDNNDYCHDSSSLSDVFGGGSASSVCISGLTTGGGIGSFKRTYGLAVDTVKSFKIVLPPKEGEKSSLVKVDKRHNQDLFWALRGCLGSNFGVISEITYILPKIDQIIMYSIVWPWSHVKSVLQLWLETSPGRPSEFNEDIGIHVIKNDKGIELGGLYVVPPGQTIEASLNIIQGQLASLIELDGTFKYEVKDYYETVSTLTGNRVYHPFSSVRIYMSSNLVDVDYIVNAYEEASRLNGIFLFAVDLLGGRIKHVSSSDTAYYPRQANFFYEVFMYADSCLDIPDITIFSKDVFHHIYNPLTDTVFVGFVIPELPNPSLSYYGSNSIRLEAIKEQVDPLGIMNYPQGLKSN
jgi:hypothetical protein